MPYLGSDEFRAWAYKKRVTKDEEVTEEEHFYFRPSIQVTIGKVAKELRNNIHRDHPITSKPIT